MEYIETDIKIKTKLVDTKMDSNHVKMIVSWDDGFCETTYLLYSRWADRQRDGQTDKKCE